jgi:hypothetical protein
LYKHTLGEDATPDNRILERAMVRANAKPDVGQVVKVTKNGELFYVLLFSVCFICILLATSNFFCLPFKLLVVKLDVKDLKLHYFFAVNARDNATAPVMMRHGTPACHVVGSTLAVRVAVRKKMKKRRHKLRMTI